MFTGEGKRFLMLNNRIPSGTAPALLIGTICVIFGVTIVIRANRMRESAVELERLSAQRDSLAMAHVGLKLRLAELCNPLEVMNRLKESGFDISSSDDIRFVLYDERIPQTGGSVPAHIRQKLVTIHSGTLGGAPASPGFPVHSRHTKEAGDAS